MPMAKCPVLTLIIFILILPIFNTVLNILLWKPTKNIVSLTRQKKNQQKPSKALINSAYQTAN